MNTQKWDIKKPAKNIPKIKKEDGITSKDVNQGIISQSKFDTNDYVSPSPSIDQKAVPKQNTKPDDTESVFSINNPFYKKDLEKHKVSFNSKKKLEEILQVKRIRKIPPTGKDEAEEDETITDEMKEMPYTLKNYPSSRFDPVGNSDEEDLEDNDYDGVEDMAKYHYEPYSNFFHYFKCLIGTVT
jgi:hypothetical protein